MKTKKSIQRGLRLQRHIVVLCLCLSCVLGTLLLVGCSPAPEQISPQSQQGAERQPGEAVVTGTVTTTGETELLIEASVDSNEFLQGPVRVDVSQVDSAVIQDLKVGDTITVAYSSQVGMSEPPFISALSLEVAN